MDTDAFKQIEAYINNLTSIFLPFGKYTEEEVNILVGYGRKIAHAVYSGATNIGLYGSPLSDELRKLRPDLLNGDTSFYFGMCRVVGREVANKTPENIDKMFGGVYRIKHDMKEQDTIVPEQTIKTKQHNKKLIALISTKGKSDEDITNQIKGALGKK